MANRSSKKKLAFQSTIEKQGSPEKNIKVTQHDQKTTHTGFGDFQVPVARPEPILGQIKAPGSGFYLPRSPAVASHWRQDLSTNAKKHEKMTHLEKLRVR